MRENNSLITVIMSTYNTNDSYLLKAVDSIVGQTYKNIELIVIVDGGEYDGCLSKINDKRLRVVVHENSLGLATRLNEAIKMARGKYVARMDSDDYALPNRLEKQYGFMERHPEIDVCGMFARKFGAEKKALISVNTSSRYIETELFINNVLWHPTIMLRRSTISKYNIEYNENFSCAQDYELWSRLCGIVKFAIIPEVGLLYRVHDGQISKSKRKKQIEFRNEIITNNMSRLKLVKNDFKYIEMLIDPGVGLKFDGLIDFIKRVLEKNKSFRVYDQKALKNIMYERLFVVLLRNHRIRLSIKYLRPYIIRYAFKKKFFALRARIRTYNYFKKYKNEGD